MATLALAGVLVYVLWPGPNLREGSGELGGAAVSVDVGSRPPDLYRIVYRVENRAGGQMIVGTETLLVRRPFDALSVRKAGPPPGAKEDNRTVNAFGRLRQGELVLAVPPATAALDRRLDTYVRAASKDGYVQPRETRRVADRPCRIFRLSAPGGIEGLERVRDIEDTYTDICIDAAGLVLEEVGVVEGKLLNRKLATGVDDDPEVPEGAFDTGDPTLDVRQGGGSVRRVTLASRPPGRFWEMREAPEGLGHEGRYTVVPPQTGFDDPTQRQRLIAFTTDVWRDGTDVLIVEQGATLGGSAPFAEDPNAREVRVGALGRGQLVYGPSSVEVRVLRDGGRFVRVTGTLEPSELLRSARSLEEVEGGDLEFLDEGPS